MAISVSAMWEIRNGQPDRLAAVFFGPAPRLRTSGTLPARAVALGWRGVVVGGADAAAERNRAPAPDVSCPNHEISYTGDGRMGFLETIGAAVVAASIVGTFALLIAGRSSAYRVALALWAIAGITVLVFTAGFQAGAAAEHDAIKAACGDECVGLPILPTKTSAAISSGLIVIVGLSALPLLAWLPNLVSRVAQRERKGPADEGERPHGD